MARVEFTEQQAYALNETANRFKYEAINSSLLANMENCLQKQLECWWQYDELPYHVTVVVRNEGFGKIDISFVRENTPEEDALIAEALEAQKKTDTLLQEPDDICPCCSRPF